MRQFSSSTAGLRQAGKVCSASREKGGSRFCRSCRRKRAGAPAAAAAPPPHFAIAGLCGASTPPAEPQLSSEQQVLEARVRSLQDHLHLLMKMMLALNCPAAVASDEIERAKHAEASAALADKIAAVTAEIELTNELARAIPPPESIPTDDEAMLAVMAGVFAPLAKPSAAAADRPAKRTAGCAEDEMSEIRSNKAARSCANATIDYVDLTVELQQLLSEPTPPERHSARASPNSRGSERAIGK